MPSNIFHKTKENRIIKDERFLREDYLPEKILYRDTEIDELVYYLKPITYGAKPTNVFITGGTGTGKTLCLKYVLNELSEYTDRVLPIYINCYYYSSPASILAYLCEQIGIALPRRGISLQEYFDRIFEYLKKNKQNLILAFDETDILLLNKDSRFIYDIARSPNKDIQMGVVMVSNNPGLVAQIDDKIRNSLSFSTILFEKYTPSQIKDILKDRISYALERNSLHPESLGIITGYAARNNGDVRLAINTLLLAAKEAEKSNSPLIQPEHVYKVIAYSASSKIVQALGSLKKEELDILSQIQETELPSSKIYENYKSSSTNPLKERRFRGIISLLISKKLVSSRFVSQGSKGTKRYLKLAFPRKILDDFLASLK